MMKKEITLQLFSHGQWVDAAQVALLESEGQGVLAPVYIAYSTNWAVEHAGSAGLQALATQYPVSLLHMKRPHWPAFLVDLLPQGYGRAELLRQLDRKPTSGPESDWFLLQHGAGNSIGHMRVKQAAEWLAQQTTPLQGFHDQEIADRAESFVEHLAQFGLFIAGSSGVQGEWPKLLLTRGKDEKLYLDHTLPDEQAAAHFIVKFSRGPNPRLVSILRHEAAYMLTRNMHGNLQLTPLFDFAPMVLHPDGIEPELFQIIGQHLKAQIKALQTLQALQ